MNEDPQSSQVGLSEDSSETFFIRWRGRQEGPYTATAIEAKLAANQIGLLHEISHNGQWITLRDYFAERDAAARAQRQAREEQERGAGASGQRKGGEGQERIGTLSQEPFQVESPHQQATGGSAGAADLSAASLSVELPLCRICGIGRYVKLNEYRMSLPVVVIGYFLLVPSAIGVLLSALGLVLYLVDRGLDVSQSAASEKGVAVLATMLGSGFFLILMVVSFVGGLLGWLLIMKKQVLRCPHCGAVVAAS